MPHLALNREQNPDITFITPMKEFKDHESALFILKAVAAQFKPITKAMGLGVNSLVEHEWNPQFAGRNWNGGEIIELVLRRRDGSFMPYTFILHVMAHELAHIKEMNHSRYFWRTFNEIKAKMLELRRKNYFGDGFWSSGTRVDAETYAPETEIKNEDLPELTCGGAVSRKKQKNGSYKYEGSGVVTKKRKRARTVKPSLHTGVQTSTGRKPGQRVKARDAFKGDGQKLDEEGKLGSTFRKQAQSKQAREARLAAAEARINNDRFEKGLPPIDRQTKLRWDEPPARRRSYSDASSSGPIASTSRSPAKSPTMATGKGKGKAKIKSVTYKSDSDQMTFDSADEIDELESDSASEGKRAQGAAEGEEESEDEDAILSYDKDEKKELRDDVKSWLDERAKLRQGLKGWLAEYLQEEALEQAKKSSSHSPAASVESSEPVASGSGSSSSKKPGANGREKGKGKEAKEVLVISDSE